MRLVLAERPGRSVRNIFSFYLTTALVCGVCVPVLAQSSTPNDALVATHSRSVATSNAVPGASIGSKSNESKPAVGFSFLPADAKGPISARVGKDDQRYWVREDAKGLHAENPRQLLETQFTRSGAEIRSRDQRWSLETLGYGYGDSPHRVREVAPEAKANRVEYRRHTLTEWYENGPLGLEQGFTLACAPGKANGRPLTIVMNLRGESSASVSEGGKDLELTGKDGKVALRYAGLQARDASGRNLRSWLEMQGNRLLLRVEDKGAQYPVVVDPWVQAQELTASDGAAYDGFGFSVAINSNTIVVGTPGHKVGSNTSQGAVYVFVQSGGTWSQQAELTASDGSASDEFGSSVAIYGSTIVVGASWHPAVGIGAPGPGAVYVFVQSGGVWSQQAELMAPDGANGDFFGFSISIDGNTLVVGATQDNVNANAGQGAAYVFVESAGTWSQQAKLIASDGANGDRFGVAVALSGSTALVGASAKTVGSNTSQGVVYVFAQNGQTWSQQAELAASDGAKDDYFGRSVAASGGTAIVGAPDHQVAANQSQGAVYIFAQSGTTWTQQAELTASDGMAYDRFGSSVMMSADSGVVGAPYHANSSNGAGLGTAYVFVDTSGTWNQQAELTAPYGSGDSIGFAVAISDSSVVAGDQSGTVGSNRYQGAAYVFVLSPLTFSPNPLNFGSQTINTTSAAQTVTLTNTGASALDITNISVSGSFAISSSTCTTLSAGADCDVSITFTPTKSGALTGTLSITANDSGSLSSLESAVAGVGTPTITGLLDNGVVSNRGQPGDRLTIQGAGFGATLGFSFATLNGMAIAGAGYVPVSWSDTQIVTIIPRGASSGPVIVTVGGGRSNSVGFFVGTEATLTPVNAIYATQAVGTTSTAQTFALTDNQPSTLTGITITTTGDFAASTTTCGTSLASLATCTVSVTFTPTATGTRTGQLIITDSANPSPQTVTLSGTAIVAATLTPDSATYANQAIGSTSPEQTFTLTNNQPTALTGIAITTTGDFAASMTTCETALASLATCTVSVTFTPTATGTRTGQLSITDSANPSPQTVTLSGTGIAQPQTAIPTCNPGGGTYTSAQTVVLSDATAGATIYYTTDGSAPTTSSTVYTSAIVVNSTETIRAIAGASGYSSSAVFSATYIIAPPPSPDFQLSVSPASLSIVAGQSGNATLTLTPENGFQMQVSFVCSGLPSESTCSFSPNSVTPNGGTVSSTLRITTTAATAAVHEPFVHGWRLTYALAFPVLGALLGMAKGGRRALHSMHFVSLVVLLGLALGLASCGGSRGIGGSGNSGTPPGTSTVTVTASAGGSALTHAAPLRVTITQ